MNRTRVGSARLIRQSAVFMIICILAAFSVFGVVHKAFAYYNFGTVGISTGTSYVDVSAGASVTTSVSVSPASDDQTLGCGMAKCPQFCDSAEAVAAGFNCFDINGQCTCAGPEYSSYFPSVYASSSDSGVATAYISGGTLVINGNNAGNATITVGASLRQWTSNETYIEVNVTQASSPNTPGSGNVSPSTNPIIPPEAASTSSRDDALNEQIIESVAGKVYVIEKNKYLNMQEALAKIAGTNDQVVVWSGTSSEQPDYSWTFTGSGITAESAGMSFDPTITISKLGTENVANLMKQAKDGLVLDFAHSGDLPGEATIFVKVSDLYADGTVLSLFTFDEQAKAFTLVQQDVTVAGGYVPCKISHCSTWAFSSDDLTKYEVQGADTSGALQNASRTTVILVVVCAVVLLVVVLFMLLRIRRKRTC